MERQLRLIVDENLQWLRVENVTKCLIVKNEFPLTFAINFLHVARISFANVALNIITCL